MPGIQFNKKHIRSYVYLFAAVIFLSLLISYLAGGLGRYPLRSAQLLTGRFALLFLLACLTITPLRTLTGNLTIGPLRQAFGLSSFYFALAHVLIMVALEYRFSLQTVFESLAGHKSLWPGAASFLILTVLAVTSLNRMKKALRGIWKKVHRWVYPAALLALAHYAWIEKIRNAKTGGGAVFPLLAAVYLFLLFLLRIKPVKEAIIRRRKQKAAL